MDRLDLSVFPQKRGIFDIPNKKLSDTAIDRLPMSFWHYTVQMKNHIGIGMYRLPMSF